MTEFHFLRPEFLLLLPLVLLITAFINQSTTASSWANHIAASKLKLLIQSDSGHHLGRSLIFGIAGILAAIALAGPTWEQRPVPTAENAAALVILLDLSPSMNAADIQPDRITRARLKITDLLRQRDDGQTALIAYSGSAHRVSPLTDDTNTIEALLPALSPEVMPESGSNVEAGFELALELLDSAGFEHNGHILLVTDGVAPDAQKNIRDMLPLGIKISILGVGTLEGAPIPVSAGNFYRDGRGDIVLARLNRNELQILAGLSSGRYIELQPDDSDLNYLLDHIDDPEADAGAVTDTEYDQWHDTGYYLVLFLIPLALLAFRRNLVFALPLIMVLTLPSQQAEAGIWQDLWLTPDQQAQRSLEAGDAASAAEQFESPDWQAYAAYQAEDYQSSVTSLEQSEEASLYNLGTSLAKAGLLEESLAALNQFIESNPDHENAVFNRDIVEQLLQQQQEQEQQENQEGGESQDQQGGENQEQEGGDSQDQENQQGQEGEEQQQGSEGDQNQEGENSEEGQNQESDQSAEDSEQNGDENSDQNSEQNSDGSPEDGSEQDSEENQQGNQGDETDETTEEEAAIAASLEDTPEEMSPASEQFLRGIPDDPSGLLRRKFEYETQLNQQQRRFAPPQVPGQSEEERY